MNAPAETSEGHMSGMKVLIVEDEVFVGWSLEGPPGDSRLKTCAVAESAADAIALAGRLGPKLQAIDGGLFGKAPD